MGGSALSPVAECSYGASGNRVPEAVRKQLGHRTAAHEEIMGRCVDEQQSGGSRWRRAEIGSAMTQDERACPAGGPGQILVASGSACDAYALLERSNGCGR